MSVFIDFHIIQSFGVSCLNRDDTGAPKTAMVGGTQRARVSSQCWKNAIRKFMHANGLTTGIRTRDPSCILKENMKSSGATEKSAAKCAEAFRTMFYGKEDEKKSAMFIFSPAELGMISDAYRKVKFNPVKVTSRDIPDMIRQDGMDAVDIIAFGRMCAQNPEFNVTGAVSFGHAVSTHEARLEGDYFTAGDDLMKNGGSGFLGMAYFTASTFYRHVSVDVTEILRYMGTDDCLRTLEVFISALMCVVPGAKRSGMAAGGAWDYGMAVIRNKGQSVSMDPAFEQAVIADDGSGYSCPSVTALKNYTQFVKRNIPVRMYGEVKTVELSGKTSADEFISDILSSVRKCI